MTPFTFAGVARRAVAVALALVAGVSVAGAQQATTTGTIRGAITARDGSPLTAAMVVATNEASGVRRGTTVDDRGRYQIPFLDPGTYTVRAQMIGYRPVERPGIRIAIGQVLNVDFQLETSPVTLQAERITADMIPLIEPMKSGTSTRISEELITELPTNGRNFKDLVVLAPGVTDQPNSGSGGGQSIGGGRTGASNLLMDGANNNESFFGGDARGGDRAPFSYSIEAVKELQVITAGYDVERGQFTGGTVNAVTKQGTNQFRGAVFGYFRGAQVAGLETTGPDFLGRAPTDFQARQYGFSLGGPIIRDRMHFFVALDRQTRNDPRPVFTRNLDPGAIRAAGVHPDTVRSIITVARDLYGYDGSREIGQFAQNTDEGAFFLRFDWQVNERHKLTLRDNYTNTNVSRDRVSVAPTSTDFLSNGGDNRDKSNSFVASLASTFGTAWSNELRAQYATEDKPRPSYPSGGYGIPLPQVIIRNIRSQVGNDLVTSEIRFGADPVLHGNLLKQRTIEIIDNVRWTRNAHSFKVGANFVNVDVFNRFWNNALGTFTFNSPLDFQNRNPLSFTRFVPATPGASLPVADYQVNEIALYAQDEWQLSPSLFLTYGLRYDLTWYPTTVAPNQLLRDRFGLDVRDQPVDNNNVSPRIGFTFDPNADGTQLIRGGSGLFFGRSPYVLWSNALLNTGGGTSTVNCSAAGTIPVPDFRAYAADPGSIPGACLGAGAAPNAPTVNVFEADYQQSYAWKTNVAYDRLIAPNWRATIEGVYATIRDNFLVQDDNLNTIPRFFIEGGIPVFVDPATVNAATGALSRANSRRDAAFDNVLVHRSLGSTLSWQGILQLEGRTRWMGLRAQYTYDRTRDNGSISCCITFSMFEQARVNGNPNDFNNQWGRTTFSREHSIMLSPTFRLPYGVDGGIVFRAFSGLPWTPRFGSDVNGDGVANDRLYVPTRAEVQTMQFFGATPDARSLNRTRFESQIERLDCLRESRGRVVARGACDNPWQYLVDARISKKFGTVRGQSVELVADFFNVLNGLNRKWGRRMTIDTDRAAGNDRFLVPRGFSNGRFVYDVNATAGQATPQNNFSLEQFQMQLGLRYNF